MTNETIINAVCYELAMWAVERWPSLAFQPWFKLLIEHCRPFWAEWKTQLTLKKVDEQAEQLKEQWEREEKEHKAETLAAKAQELFPKATITPLPDAIVPSVMIVHEAPPDASDEIKALGGELRITWKLEA